ncbi:hypothetical protein G7068_13815 [Leucobacter viscericola]|uniref:Scaffolding protein n=1 Tax=Leucobacter viscericola TaxID=2714935 RepID=A0A6G7XI50_9MICO|nr:hypothetical protein [Leucobacter viscericola]QIK64156.1 hypothetical protein G7068_13815 [Leucobacter viscericola]
MNTSTFRQGEPATVGWSIGRAPLALRGIRFADGENGAAPAAPAGGEAASSAASPADVAAMLATLGKATPPQAAPAPEAPAAAQQIQGFTPEQVQKLMTENQTALKAAEDAQAALAAAEKARDEASAQVASFQRDSAVRTAAGDTANAALLLDSASFQASIKEVDLTDTAALGAAVKAFVDANPAYAAAPTLPGTSGATPSGGTNNTPKTLDGVVAAAMSA